MLKRWFSGRYGLYSLMLGIVLVPALAQAQEEEQGSSIYVQYLGQAYQQLELYDKDRNLVLARRLVSGQGLAYPNITKKTRLKTFYLHIGAVHYTLKHGCKKKEIAKGLAKNTLNISYYNTKPVCVIAIEGQQPSSGTDNSKGEASNDTNVAT